MDLAVFRGAAEGKLDAVREAVAKGGSVNASKAETTALMVASYRGYTNIVEFLISKGANIHAISADGSTALMYASAYGHEGCVDLLISAGARPNVQSAEGATALSGAAALGNESIVRKLLAAGADVSLKDKHGHTAETVATTSGNTHIASILRSQAGGRFLSESKEAPGGGSSASSGSSDLANFLRQERLESYKEDLAALGAMTVNDLLALTQDDLDLVGMKKVEKMRFLRAVARATGGDRVSVAEWLASLRLSKYEAGLRELGATTLEDMKYVGEADLHSLGMLKVERKRFVLDAWWR